MRQVIGSLIFSILLIFLTIYYATGVVLLWPTPFSVRCGFIRQYARLVITLLRLLCNVRYEVRGQEHIPESAAIIFSKHQSAWETFALQVFFPFQAFVVKRELLRLPFFGWGLAALRAIAIDRSSGKKAIEQIVEQGRQRLNAGQWIVIFPEGTRVPAGTRKRYKMGGAVLATRTGYPVVPVAHNAGEFWPKRGFLKKPGTINMRIGPAIPTEGRSPEEVMADAERWIETTMVEISTPPYPAYDK